jgi:hypothetical protein
MSFDKRTRNKVASIVGDCRRLLTDDIRHQLQAVYGLQPDGTALPVSSLSHLDERGHEVASALRLWQEHLASTEAGTETQKRKAAFDRLAHETAFTVLNRLAALRMCEERGHVIECVRRGLESDGFALYERFSEGVLGGRGETYRIFLERMFAELSVDLPSLFDLDAPQSLVFPRERCLEEALSLLNRMDMAHVWADDETIGWIYQYFNSKEEREAMREASAAPRNSREFAVRNQFFTPRYVVEFLVDNTLGRLWYEIRQGETVLKESCRYLVRRPSEIFLSQGQDARENPSRDELAKQPVYIPYRARRDPRTIRILDPAVGSGHFLLYAFDLLEAIYQEAWEEQSQPIFEATGKTLRDEYDDLTNLRVALPGLILRHNLHGIDIDLRACQIAALALWLRAQHTYQHLGLKSSQRPKIERSNIVCAEPMPGEQGLLDQFLNNLQPKVIGQLVKAVFEKMKLAGEAGSLLKIEEEIADAVAAAKQKWLTDPKPEQGLLFAELARPQQANIDFDFSGITNEAFWEKAEARIYAELQRYAEQAENGHGYQRRLFADDATRGFAFIDLCRKRYDVALMNPPFGDASLPSKPYLDEIYGDTRGDVYKAFVECFQARLLPSGYLGIISSRTGFFLGQSEDWRTRIVLRLFRPIVLADLGMGVLDAMVEVAAYVLRSLSSSETQDLTLSLVPVLKTVALDGQKRFSLPKWQAARGGLKRHQAVSELGHLEAAGYVHRCAGDIIRYSPSCQALEAVGAAPIPVFPPFVCLRALTEEDKGPALVKLIYDPASKGTFVCDPGQFSNIPGNTFAYWCSKSILDLFTTLPSLAESGREVRTTNPTCDDFRFARTWWEPKAGNQSRWRTWNKGGGFSPFYRDIDLVIDWDDHRNTYRGYLGTIYRPDIRPANLEYFSRPGLTWVYRGHRLCIQAMPEGTVISKRGSGIYAEEDVCRFDLGLLNSTMADYLIKLTLGRSEHPQFDVGDINSIPVPPLDSRISDLAILAWAQKHELDRSTETSHAFVQPAVLKVPGEGIVQRSAEWSARIRAEKQAFEAIQSEIDELVFELYNLNTADRSAVNATCATESISETSLPSEENGLVGGEGPEAVVTTGALFSYLLGVSFGRWNIRLAPTGKATKLPDPFAPLPVCPPGMLQNRDGLPMTREDIDNGDWDYPVEIRWDGILVDDEDSPNDVVRQIRETLRVIWEERADLIEQESCEILGIKDLREYFRKPSLFFAFHLKGYSKSGRQAPIYWPLSTASGSYTLWIYCPRLNDDSLHTALNKYVKPKIDDAEKELRRIESELPNANGREASSLRNAFAETGVFLDELREFRDELARIADLPYKPDLNDGVLITASPFWKLFRLPMWRKDLQECWKKLETGDYDWAHLAYSIWPDRVREVCKHDRSIAIAHDLESLCELAAEPPKKKRSKKIAVEETVPGDEE